MSREKKDKNIFPGNGVRSRKEGGKSSFVISSWSMIRGGKDKSCNSEKAEEKRLGWVDVQREGSLPEEEKRKRRNACIVCTG